VKLLVREKWEMEVADTVGGQPWFADWVSRKINDSSAHISAGATVLNRLAASVEEPLRILEGFGGLGCQSLIAHDLWPRAGGTIYETSHEAVEHLRSVRNTILKGAGIGVHLSDAYMALDPDEDDVVLLDFGDMTASRMVAGGRYTTLLERVFHARPRAVVLTDIAGRLLHLHRDHYAKALRTEFEDYKGYLLAVGQYVRDRWGYYPLETSYQNWSAVMGFVPTAYGHTIGPVIDDPRGLRKL